MNSLGGRFAAHLTQGPQRSACIISTDLMCVRLVLPRTKRRLTTPHSSPLLASSRRQAQVALEDLVAGAQAAHCHSLGGSHRAWQAHGGYPPALVNRPLFQGLGPHPVLQWPSPGSESGSLPTSQVMTLSSGHPVSAMSCHWHPMDRGSDAEALGRGEQSPRAHSVQSTHWPSGDGNGRRSFK